MSVVQPKEKIEYPESEELGIGLRLERNDLVMYDCLTGQRLYGAAEAAEAACEAAERRATDLAAEVQRLRDELQRKTRN